jgi:hypothetical protein
MPYNSGYAKTVGGSGKRQLADGVQAYTYAIGKLRRLRLPLPPVVAQLA